MGCSYWQILPINHLAEGNSPYTNRSLFAINPNFIDLYALAEQGLLSEAEITDAFAPSGSRQQELPILEKKRLILLRKAFSRIDESAAEKVRAFAKQNAHWLDSYALFTVLKNVFGDVYWNEWPGIGFRLHKPDAIAQANLDYENDVFFWKFVQYVIYTQWAEFKAYVNGLGIGIIGDIPIYASFDSSDVWAGNQLFQLNTKHIPKRVGGVPPDYFNRNGQLWGNPLYDWDEMKKDGYAWWLSRIENALTIYDIIRIDHFRGFYSYWAVPYANKTAKKGEWVKGPGMDLIRKVRARFSKTAFVMEDLGSLDRSVKKFFTATGYPGMRVMQFGFGPDGDPAHLAKNFPEDCVAYTGTHDNNTIVGWYQDASEETRADSLKELGLAKAKTPPTDQAICRAWVESLFRSDAGLVIVPIQDLLCEGSEARMNFPGTLSPANWSYQVTEESLGALDTAWVLGLNQKYGRGGGTPVGGDGEKTVRAAGGTGAARAARAKKPDARSSRGAQSGKKTP
jgi:4-alpha-glucanotransferase